MNMGRIGSQNYSYRQGVVLGLTMAEVTLLLLFCLLIASSAVLMFEKNQRATAERRLNDIVSVEGIGSNLLTIYLKNGVVESVPKERGRKRLKNLKPIRLS